MVVDFEGRDAKLCAYDRATGRVVPLRRSNTGDDIANLAAFLASEEARNITGQSLNVDGGLMLMWD
jgi:NAD(P)-dependent dehydrogenase (short-subunit alcohol dehydrogenase family)